MKKPIRIQFKDAGMEYLQMDARLEVKSVGENGILHIKAYACAFGNVDSSGDIIEPNACDAFLAGPDAKRMAFCWQHDTTTVIGKFTDKGVDEYGMWFEADVLPTSVGKDAAILLKEGAITEFSIGYRADQWKWKKLDDGKTIRILKAITIYEVSPVTIAANPKARIISAKADNNNAPTADPAAAHNSSQTNRKNQMTPEEIKALNETLAEHKKAAEKAAAELKAAQDELKASQEKIEAQEKSIDNLDKSVKALQAKCDDLAKKAETQEAITFYAALKSALEAKRDEVKTMLESNKGSMKIPFEVKTDPLPLTTGQISNIAYGVALEPGIHDARPLANVFYESFPKDTVSATQFDWLEGSFTDAADYVSELTEPALDEQAVTEKSRKFGKIAARLQVSSEVADFFEEVYNWARNTAQKKILAKIDTEILTGLGADSGAGTSPNKIYGLKANSANYTAFTATGAKYADATIADVILDAQAQALSAGYTLDVAFVTWAEYAEIKGLKDANGNYLFNQVTGILNGIVIKPTSKLSSGEILLAESGVVRIKERPVWELEIVRNAKLDGWDVYVRKAAQTLVKSNDKAGVIYVASVATAIAAITKDSAIATIAGTVDADAKAVKTKTVSE